MKKERMARAALCLGKYDQGSLGLAKVDLTGEQTIREGTIKTALLD